MEDWKSFIKNKIAPEIRNDSTWKSLIESIEREDFTYGVHLAIFNEPYLSYIFQGKKTIESRFSKNKIAPYKDVYENDLVLFKLSGGAVTGICQVGDIWHYRLDPKTWEGMRKEYTLALCAQDPTFWKDRQKASYATLMTMKHIKQIAPINFSKSDRRGWVVLKNRCDTIEAMNSKPVMIAISGRIGSGKSTLSKALSETLSWTYVSFGKYVRAEARKRNMSQDRKTLQKIGAELLEDSLGFCSDVLSQVPNATESIIIDGVRNEEVLNALYKVRPNFKVILVYIDIDENVRLDRLQNRESHDYVNLLKIESHITETDVKDNLKLKADIVVDGELTTSELTKKIISKIE